MIAASNPGGVVYVWKNGDWVADTSIVAAAHDTDLQKYTNSGLNTVDLDGDGQVDFLRAKGSAKYAYRNKAKPEYI